jgi:hypothetical protein
MSDLAIYVFVRGDLPEEDQLVQAAHAIFKMTACYLPDSADLRIVALDGGSSEKAFFKTLRRLQDAQIAHATYCDSDKPEWGITAIATVPLDREQSLPLANYRLRRYSPGVRLTSEAQPSVAAGEPTLS